MPDRLQGMAIRIRAKAGAFRGGGLGAEGRRRVIGF
jgi:hypothetical protein